MGEIGHLPEHLAFLDMPLPAGIVEKPGYEFRDFHRFRGSVDLLPVVSSAEILQHMVADHYSDPMDFANVPVSHYDESDLAYRKHFLGEEIVVDARITNRLFEIIDLPDDQLEPRLANPLVAQFLNPLEFRIRAVKRLRFLEMLGILGSEVNWDYADRFVEGASRVKINPFVDIVPYMSIPPLVDPYFVHMDDVIELLSDSEHWNPDPTVLEGVTQNGTMSGGLSVRYRFR